MEREQGGIGEGRREGNYLGKRRGMGRAVRETAGGPCDYSALYTI